jgi:cytidylate kinase
MTAADGVVTIDSTNLTFDQTVDAVVAYIRSASA